MDTARILIVDDDEAVLQALPAALELRLEGLAIDTVGSGTAALQKVEVTDYDTIVCDVKLPGMDGLALMDRIHALCPHTPTLLITGHGDYDLGIQALKAGAYAFVTKPIDRNYFIAWVQRAIQLRQLSRQVEEQKRMLRQQAQDLEQVVQERTATLTDLRQRLSRVVDASEAGCYEYSVPTGRTMVDERWARNLGYDLSELPPIGELHEWWEARLHPEDRAETVKANQDVIEGRSQEYRLEYRLRNKAGGWQWLRSINIAVERDGRAERRWSVGSASIPPTGSLVKREGLGVKRKNGLLALTPNALPLTLYGPLKHRCPPWASGTHRVPGCGDGTIVVYGGTGCRGSLAVGGEGVKVWVRLNGRTIAACGRGSCNEGTADGGWAKLGEYHCRLVIDRDASAEGCLEVVEGNCWLAASASRMADRFRARSAWGSSTL